MTSILNYIDTLAVMVAFGVLGAYTGGTNPGWQYGIIIGVKLGCVANAWTPLAVVAPLFDGFAIYLEWRAQTGSNPELNGSGKGAIDTIKYLTICIFLVLSLIRCILVLSVGCCCDGCVQSQSLQSSGSRRRSD